MHKTKLNKGYKSKGIICVNPLPKTENYYFRRLNVKDLFDKKILKKVKPYFNNTLFYQSKLYLNNQAETGHKKEG